jgi:hypothetical protein
MKDASGVFFGFTDYTMSERVFLFRAGSIRETVVTVGWFLYFGLGASFAIGGCIVVLGLLLAPKGGQAGLLLWIVAALALSSTLLVWHLALCWRHRLYLCEDGIARRDLRALAEINFADVVGLKWHSEALGGAVVRTDVTRIRVNLAPYRPEARLRIVRHLQRAVPPSSQEDWNLFCFRIALPLARPDARPYKILPIRTRFDRLCGMLLFCEFAFLVADWRFAGVWKTAALSCAVTAIGWITTRSFLLESYRIPSAQFMPLELWLGQMVDHVVLGLRMLGLLCIGIALLSLNPLIGGVALVALFALIGFNVLFHTVRAQLRVWRAFKDRNKEDPQACEAAVREWDALDGAPASAPSEMGVATQRVGASSA